MKLTSRHGLLFIIIYMIGAPLTHAQSSMVSDPTLVHVGARSIGTTLVAIYVDNEVVGASLTTSKVGTRRSPEYLLPVDAPGFYFFGVGPGIHEIKAITAPSIYRSNELSGEDRPNFRFQAHSKSINYIGHLTIRSEREINSPAIRLVNRFAATHDELIASIGENTEQRVLRSSLGWFDGIRLPPVVEAVIVEVDTNEETEALE